MRISIILDRFVETLILVGILSITLLVCCSCGSTKVVTQTVEHVSKDTVYLSNIQYDSIFVYQERNRDYHRAIGTLEHGTLEPDTVFLKDVSIEYRYRLLGDTIRIVERDSIPYEVTITETKEITRPLTWYDHLSRISLRFMIGFLTFAIYRRFKH